MYNNTGLPTARGSGTNAYVQKNLANPGHKTGKRRADKITPGKKLFGPKKLNSEIKIHNSKREIFVKCLEEENRLRQSKLYTPEEIESRVSKLRKELERKLQMEFNIQEAVNEGASSVGPEKKEATEQELRDAKLRFALGIKESLNTIKTNQDVDSDKIKSFEEGSIVKQDKFNAKLVRKAKY